MNYLRFIICLLCILSWTFIHAAEENFLLIHGKSDHIVQELGPNLNERMTPCSTFKIALSLMGFDSGILQDEKHPVWLFQEGYDDFLDSWKSSQTPYSWMKTSCIWYSRILASQLGLENFQKYLTDLNYGNQDASGGLTSSWLSSSLKISPKEQVDFIKKLVNESLPISVSAMRITKSLLLVGELSNGWKLFGKTGCGLINTPNGKYELGWFIGWIEKDNDFFPFAFNICDIKIDPSQRIPRVKELLKETKVMETF